MLDFRVEVLEDRKPRNKNKDQTPEEDLFMGKTASSIYVVTTQKDIEDKKKELESAYRADPVIFNSINLYAQVAMHAGFKFGTLPKYHKDAEVQESINFIDTFFDNIGDFGRKLDKETFIDTTFRFLGIYGSFYGELINNNNGNIVDVNVLDPKKIDYARDPSGNIVFDNFGNPVGYIETIDYGSVDREIVNKITPPKEIPLNTNELYLPADRIAHLKLYTFGDGLDGVGLIEPGYLASKYKLNMEKAFANLTLKYANPKMHISVGDQTHEPTPTHIRNALKSVLNINQNTEFAAPYWVDIKTIQANQPDQVKDIMEYYISQQIAATGIPAAYSTGGSDATNRSTLNRMEYMMKLRLKDIMRRVSMTFEKQIINKILETNGRKSSMNKVKLIWGEIATEELDAKATRLTQYFSMGLVRKDIELEKYIRKLEELPDPVEGGFIGP